MHPVRSEKLVVQQVGDDIVALIENEEGIHHLNETAALILSKCDGHHGIADITEAVSEKYEVSVETAERDVVEIIEQLMELKMIVAAESIPPSGK